MSALSKRLPSWLAGLIVLAIAAVLLELLLQVLSFGAFLLYRKPSLEESSGREGKVVFCVGDSFTFGYGASDLSKSYPNCLENYLEQETGEPWTVVNCGYPNRNSSQMGEALTQAVISGPAEFVVLVGGVNDSWSGAIRLEINTLNAALTAGRGGENRQRPIPMEVPDAEAAENPEKTQRIRKRERCQGYLGAVAEHHPPIHSGLRNRVANFDFDFRYPQRRDRPGGSSVSSRGVARRQSTQTLPGWRSRGCHCYLPKPSGCRNWIFRCEPDRLLCKARTTRRRHR